MPLAHYNRGVALQAEGKHHDAIAEYREAVRLQPGLADAHYNLAMVYSVMDEMELAMSALEEVVRIRPEDGEAFYRLAMGHYSRRNVERAWSYLMLAKKAGYPVPSQMEEALRVKWFLLRKRGEGKP